MMLRLHSPLDFFFSERPLPGLHLLHHAPPLVQLTQVVQRRETRLPDSFGPSPIDHLHLCQAGGQTATWWGGRSHHRVWMWGRLQTNWFESPGASGTGSVYPKSEERAAGALWESSPVGSRTRGSTGRFGSRSPGSPSAPPRWRVWAAVLHPVHRPSPRSLWGGEKGGVRPPLVTRTT